MSEEAEVLVLLHGFAGTSRAFDAVIAQMHRARYRPMALDLPGHGPCGESRQAITFERCVQDVLARSPARFALCGYSLGGRIALQLALAQPQRVSRLILISTSAGIDSQAERAARIAADEELASALEQRPFEEFIDRWRSQPLFRGEPPHVRELAAADHRRNRPRALAAALRGIGAGRMAPMWERLGELRMPVSVLAGERDPKYVRLAAALVAGLPHAQLTLLTGGHGLLLECPAAVAAAIESGPADPRGGDRATPAPGSPHNAG